MKEKHSSLWKQPFVLDIPTMYHYFKETDKCTPLCTLPLLKYNIQCA